MADHLTGGHERMPSGPTRSSQLADRWRTLRSWISAHGFAINATIFFAALTNARKHAGRSASAVVRLAYLGDAIAIEGSDDGVGAMSSLATTGAGNGMLGMRERVDICGGTFEADPRPGGGFSVSVSLPVPHATNRPSVESTAPTISEEVS